MDGKYFPGHSLKFLLQFSLAAETTHLIPVPEGLVKVRLFAKIGCIYPKI